MHNKVFQFNRLCDGKYSNKLNKYPLKNGWLESFFTLISKEANFGFIAHCN